MDSYPNPYAQPTDAPVVYGDGVARPPLSALAVASLVCSLIVCCPIVTLIGPLLGLSAIISISAHPTERRGKGLAMAGIIIGILTTALGGAGIVYLMQVYRGMGEFVADDVPAAMDAAFDGKLPEFRAVLSPRAANAATDAQIQQFLDGLMGRYGPYIGMRLASDMSTFRGGDEGVIMPVEFEFEGGKVVAAEVYVILEKPTRSGWRLDSITVADPTLGDLSFP